MKINKSTIVKATTNLRYNLDKHSPEIFLGLGLATFVGTVIVACRATLKADEVLKEHEEKMKDIEKAKEVAEEDPERYDYDEELYQDDIRNQKIKTSVKILSLYGPVAALGAISVGCILKSRNILNGRYLAAVSAYNGLTEVFEQYRQRVRDEEGEEMDRHYRYGTERKTVVKEEVDPETGKKKKTKEEVEELDRVNVMMDATTRWFDSSNKRCWDSSPSINMMFLRAKQTEFNTLLQVRGVIFLNEVLDQLGFEKCQEGAQLGWTKDGRHGYIDFGLYKSDEETRRFVNGQDNAILLEFNVDGIIWDKIPKVTGAAA